MKHPRTLVLAASFLLAFTMNAAAQQPSLADLARQQRAQKSAAQKKVYTNEDIPAPTISGTPSEAPSQPAEAAATEAKPADAAAAGTQELSQEELEKQYREKFAKAREEQELQERKLDILQRELNLMQIQYSSDPQATMQQELTRENITKRVEEIEAQKQAVEKAKQAVADLETELQRKGLPIGWAR